MPVWHERTAALRASGKLQLVGIVEEQHADRARLFAQWQEFDWPVMVDAANFLGVSVVPLFFAVDEHGVIRARYRSPREFDERFAEALFDDPGPIPRHRDPALRDLTRSARTPRRQRDLGDAVLLHGGPERLDDAIAAYQRALEDDPDGVAHFRLGSALRRRYESDARRATDFGAALARWTEALERNPRNYIWRRRIQQYGPRLTKPYPFYGWVERARAAIRERGETPVELIAALTTSESLAPARAFPDGEAQPAPDPHGKIPRDGDRLIAVELALAPAHLAPGKAARLHVALRPSTAQTAKWSNEATPVKVWLEPPPGWRVDRPLRVLPQPADRAESSEVRRVEFEVRAPDAATADSGQGAPARTVELCGYALYNVCEGAGGLCRYLRQDFRIPALLRPAPAR